VASTGSVSSETVRSVSPIRSSLVRLRQARYMAPATGYRGRGRRRGRGRGRGRGEGKVGVGVAVGVGVGVRVGVGVVVGVATWS
jgi:hypothetical protein